MPDLVLDSVGYMKFDLKAWYELPHKTNNWHYVSTKIIFQKKKYEEVQF
jgi:hypothetical protein